MHLQGSCHCGAVRFSVLSRTPYPVMLCYCSICRKTAGGGGYAVNLMGDNETLTVRGRRHARVYQATIDGELSEAQRHFCGRCGSALWLWDPRWPELIHPFASAIDSELPPAPESAHIMLDSAAGWVPRPRPGRKNKTFAGYGADSIEGWHRAHGLYEDEA